MAADDERGLDCGAIAAPTAAASHRPPRLPAIAALLLRDPAIALALGLCAAFISIRYGDLIDRRVYDSFNILFQSDPPRVISNMSERFSRWQNATAAHPLLPILGLPPVKLLARFGADPVTAIGRLLAIAAALSTACLYLSARGLGLDRRPATLLTGMFLASATFLHWYAIVESYAFAGLSVLLMLATGIRSAGRKAGLGWLVAASGTLAITITNWSLALLFAVFTLPRRRMLLMVGGSFAIVLALAIVQSRLFPGAFLFLDPKGLARASQYNGLSMHRLGVEWNPLASLRSALFTSAVAPPPVIATVDTDFGPFTLVTNQFQPWRAMPWPGLAATGLWALLLAIGAWTALATRPRPATWPPLIGFALSQVAFHSVYGEITFLYSADFFPALLLLAGLGWHARRLRPLVEGAMLLFILVGGIHNSVQFRTAAQKAQTVAIAKAKGQAAGRL
ncbi:MAG: hypothetical protein QM690_02365 [Sphingobium sp.]